jgi:hypothetical protein
MIGTRGGPLHRIQALETNSKLKTKPKPKPKQGKQSEAKGVTSQ